MSQITVSIDLEKDPATFVVHGELCAQEIIEKVEEFYIGNPTKLVLWVLEDAVTSGISGEEIEQIIRIAKKYSGSRKKGKTAIVGPKEIDYGLGRMYQAYADIERLPYEYRIFKELEEAQDWLVVK